MEKPSQKERAEQRRRTGETQRRLVEQKLSYKERARQLREREILQVARQLICERGFANVSMDEVAEAVGVSKPTLYQHFNSKETLLARVFIQGFEALEETVETAQGSALERLQLVMRTILEAHRASESLMASVDRGVAFNVMCSNPELMERRQRGRQQLFALVEEAKAQGEIVSTIPTPVIVNAMFGLIGALRHGLFRQEAAEDDESAIDYVIQIFLHGITP